MGFLMEAFNDANYLEKVSGLADMLENTNFDDVRINILLAPPRFLGRLHTMKDNMKYDIWFLL